MLVQGTAYPAHVELESSPNKPTRVRLEFVLNGSLPDPSPTQVGDGSNPSWRHSEHALTDRTAGSLLVRVLLSHAVPSCEHASSSIIVQTVRCCASSLSLQHPLATGLHSRSAHHHSAQAIASINAMIGRSRSLPPIRSSIDDSAVSALQLQRHCPLCTTAVQPTVEELPVRSATAVRTLVHALLPTHSKKQQSRMSLCMS